MKMFGKQTSALQRVLKRAGDFELPRSRAKGRTSLQTKDFWRALSSAALASPQTPVPRRLHD